MWLIRIVFDHLGIDVLGNWEVKGRMVLPHKTRLSGQLYLGDTRAHGHVTQAVTPNGDTFTVCMELIDIEGRERGVEIVSRSGRTAAINWSVDVQAVDHFE